MLADLLEIGQRILLTLHDSGHATERSAFELLAAVHRVAELEQADIVLGDLINEVAGSAQLTESEFVVVLIVEDVHEGCQERVQIVEDRKLGQDRAKLLVKRVLRELDFSHVEVANAANFEVFVDDLQLISVFRRRQCQRRLTHRRRLALGLTEHYVEEIIGRGDRRYRLEAFCGRHRVSRRTSCCGTERGVIFPQTAAKRLPSNLPTPRLSDYSTSKIYCFELNLRLSSAVSLLHHSLRAVRY